MKYGEKPKEGLNGATQEFNNFSPPSVASRARNRTVMLSPDVTGQVRSLLQAPISTRHVSSVDDDPFQKPKNSMIESYDDTLIDVRKSSENATKGTSGHTNGTLEMVESFSNKAEKVEGTLELQREHSKRVTGERKFEELGIGFANVEDRKDSGQLKEALGFNQNRNLLAKEPPTFRKEFEPSKREEPPVRRDVEHVGKPSSRVVGFLISYDKEDAGEVIDVRVGRWLVSSKKTKDDNVMFIDDETISPLHAVIKVSNFGDIQVMDQLSDNGSGILRINSNGEIDASEAPVKLQHGDLIRFGKRYFVFCGIPKMQIES